MKILVVGYGSIGKRHIDNLAMFPGITILVCTKKKYDSFLKKRKCRTFNSLEQCIKEKPDAALITNETSYHVPIAIKLARNGCHLFIEKPLSNSTEKIETLLKIIKNNNLITQIGCNLRYHPCLKKIKRMISKNEIGRIISAEAYNGSFLPDWHPNEEYQHSYASREDLGGGVVLTCIHEIDYLYWFFGHVANVYSITGKFSDLQVDTDDLSTILFQFKNKIIAEIHLDYFQKPTSRYCKIIGTKGTVYCDLETNEVKMYDVKKRKWKIILKLKNYDSNSMYVNELKNFLEYVKKNKISTNDVHEGLNTLRIALAVKQASKTKKMVKLC